MLIQGRCVHAGADGQRWWKKRELQAQMEVVFR